MTIKLAYIISMLICYVPRFVKTFIYNHKLNKEGYEFANNSAFIIYQVVMLLSTAIYSLIPMLNIYKGLETVYKLIRFKKYYAQHKIDLMSKDMIVKEENTFSDTLVEMKEIFADATKGEKDIEVKNASEILELLIYIDSKGYDIEDNFEKLDINERLEYLKKLKKEIEDNEKCEVSSNEKEEENQKKLIRK
jgi:uncharacterized protein YdiU (UPF0061 family)